MLPASGAFTQVKPGPDWPPVQREFGRGGKP